MKYFPTYMSNMDVKQRTRCANCDWQGLAGQTHGIQKIGHRLDPGSIVPVGECPDCGALAYYATSRDSMESIKVDDVHVYLPKSLEDVVTILETEILLILETEQAFGQESESPVLVTQLTMLTTYLNQTIKLSQQSQEGS